MTILVKRARFFVFFTRNWIQLFWIPRVFHSVLAPMLFFFLFSFFFFFLRRIWWYTWKKNLFNITSYMGLIEGCSTHKNDSLFICEIWIFVYTRTLFFLFFFFNLTKKNYFSYRRNCRLHRKQTRDRQRGLQYVLILICISVCTIFASSFFLIFQMGIFIKIIVIIRVK